MAIPYENATSGSAAREETTKLLRQMGCSSVGWMDDFDTSEVLLAFTHNGQRVQMRASAKGWAAWYLRENPWNKNRRSTPEQHEYNALKQGLIAINSILRDWVKGSVTAVQCGLMTPESMFLAHMVAPDGRALIEVVRSSNLLEGPKNNG
jgi:hypothetical protein